MFEQDDFTYFVQGTGVYLDSHLQNHSLMRSVRLCALFVHTQAQGKTIHGKF